MKKIKLFTHTDLDSSPNSRVPHNIITMKSKNIDKETLSKLYHVDGKSMTAIAKDLGVNRSVIKRWLKESDIQLKTLSKSHSKYSLNELYFDNIDSSEKAYWLGFIWGDGYVCKRERNGNLRYELKLSLSSQDIEHLNKFKKSIGSNHEIKTYEIKTGYKTKNVEARLYICNKHFVSTIYERYFIRPFKQDFNEFIKNIPSSFYVDFIRGLFDADGGMMSRNIDYRKTSRKEFSIGLIASPDILDFFNEQLIKNNLTKTIYKQWQRHLNSDSDMRNIRITGNNKVLQILKWLYKDKEVPSLARKYSQFIFISNYMEAYRKEGEL